MRLLSVKDYKIKTKGDFRMKINIDEVKKFHGHMCPGLAIGIRVAEKALLEMGDRPGDEEVVLVAETNNCAVDALQFITGCTAGKGNLKFLEYGKNAFRFFRRSDGKAIRILVDMDGMKPISVAVNKVLDNTATDDDKQRIAMERQARTEQILSADLDELMTVQQIECVIPQRAKIFNSVECAKCGEKTMECLLRPIGGELHCPECYELAMGS